MSLTQTEVSYTFNPRSLVRVNHGRPNARAPSRQTRANKKKSIFGQIGETNKPITTTLLANDLNCSNPTTGRAIVQFDQEPTPESIRQYKKDIQMIRSSLTRAKITGVSHNLWSHEEIVNNAVVKVDNSGKLGKRTINDRAMGSSSPEDRCTTCQQNLGNCIGHYGYINLSTPIMHPLYYSEIVMVLSSICNDCGGLLLSDEDFERHQIGNYRGLQRLKMISNLATKGQGMPCRRTSRPPSLPRECSPEGTPEEEEDDRSSSVCRRNPVFKKDKLERNILIYKDPNTDKDVPMSVDRILCIFQGIDKDEETLRKLGFSGKSKPSDFILRSLLVIPPCARSSAVYDSGLETDQLGKFYIDIINKNNGLKEVIHRNELEERKTILIANKHAIQRKIVESKRIRGRDQTKQAEQAEQLTKKGDDLEKTITKITDELENIKLKSNSTTNVDALEAELTNSIKRYLDSKDTRLFAGGQTISGLVQTIGSGKKAMVRGNMAGKRVDFGARTVVGPGEDYKSNQFGVPRDIAAVTTYPVMVANYNRLGLQELLRVGKVNSVLRMGMIRSNRIELPINDNNRDTFQLKIGDVVERHLQNGDTVLINRQPSLHAGSMVAVEVVIHDDSNFKLPLVLTTTFNADFDGDEMAMYIPQDPLAIAETRGIKNAVNCVLSPETGKPEIGLVMDAVSGAYRLTMNNPQLSSSQFNNILFNMTDPPDSSELNERASKNGVRRYSGRALFSAVLPPDFYYSKNGVLIQNGILTQGVLTKGHVGNAHGSIIQELAKRYSNSRASQFLTDSVWLLNKWQSQDPFTVSLRDCFPTTEEHLKVRDIELAKGKIITNQMGAEPTDPLEFRRQEQEIVATVNRAGDIGGRVAEKYLDPNNSLRIMHTSGAKGSKTNIAQITTLVSQQFVQGQRPKKTISNGTRCLPYFDSNDRSPETQGFCGTSYIKGLEVPAYVFAATGGREGLINTALTTADTGDLNRRLFKSMEDLVVAYDGSVRNAAGEIIQMAYGYDGLEPRYVQKIAVGGKNSEPIPWFINLDQVAKQLNTKYGFPPS